MVKQIFCCECNAYIPARLTDSSEIYPHKRLSYILPFWICDICKNYVGCHYKSQDKLKPLGIIAGAKLRQVRVELHRILDPIWKDTKLSRTELYNMLSRYLGYDFHIGNVNSVEEVTKISKLAININNEARKRYK